MIVETKASRALKAWLKTTENNQTKLAAALNVGQTTVSSWTRGVGEPRIPEALWLEENASIPIVWWTLAAEAESGPAVAADAKAAV